MHLVDGTERVIEPPQTEGLGWYPFTVAWSPDGETLLYTGWTAAGGGVVAVRADVPHQVTVLIDGIDPVPDYYSHRWTPIQMWGRQSG